MATKGNPTKPEVERYRFDKLKPKVGAAPLDFHLETCLDRPTPKQKPPTVELGDRFTASSRLFGEMEV